MTWQPSASIETLRLRANILIKIRDFFYQRGYLEVDTPQLARFGVTDVYLENIKAAVGGRDYCLQTSPEYHMKRLLAAGSGPIFQMARAFRDDELGRWHNPEFTMLEWYQLDIDHHALMDEMDELLQLVLDCPPLVKKTYQQAFYEVCDMDVLQATVTELQETLVRFNLDNVLAKNEQDRDQYLFLLMSHIVEPAISHNNTPVAVYNFPASQAALAQVKNGVAERFEIYCQGIELANGFHELTDVHSQSARFKQDCLHRQEKGMPVPMPDEFLIAALRSGLPPCSGVALGIDRLVALALNQIELASVMAFDFSRA